MAGRPAGRMENALNDAVIVRWDRSKRRWVLSPYAEDTRIDSKITHWQPLPRLAPR